MGVSLWGIAASAGQTAGSGRFLRAGPGSDTSLRECHRRGARYCVCMMRKVFWLFTLVATTSVVLNFMDQRRAKRRRELWAEATDPL